MKLSLHDRLLARELGTAGRYSGLRDLYGDRTWIDDLDIVNELGGHTGCVNALCWSKSGRFLASGSDDQHLNIYSYLPDSTSAPFTLNTTISTGHTSNIFSVKFMPHSNDQTLVTCAGDSEVRVFDIEYAGRSTSTSQQSETASSIRSQRYNNYFPGLRYLNEITTNAKVFRSHADRVKRIVTESSPYLFLSCSEDGEVRQWDLRQPSSMYPAPLGGRGFMSYRTAREHDSSNVPPPLISYKKYHLDLNSISCSASQPHYIALGGAHLHCFLHDRRMLGRDLADERGQADSPAPAAGSHDDELMGQATRCVRRFAPNGQRRMKRTDNGHITACKISDANPNEMIVSWSGEHVYSFDLVQSPDAREAEEREVSSRTSRSTGRAKKDLKRKRDKATSTTSLASVRPRSRLRQDDDPSGDEITLRVRYGNGQSEDIPVEPSSHQADISPTSLVERVRQDVLTEAQKLSYRLAEGLVKLRKMLFSLEASSRQASQTISSLDLTPHTRSLTSVLGYAASYLPLMDEVMRDWRYPVNPSTQDIAFHQTMRKNRASARRFMQASGTLARALGGKLRTAGSGESPHLQLFREIVPAPNEGTSIDTESQFSYDFLKAILLWLDGGPQALLQGFKRPPDQRLDSPRFPLPDVATQDAIDDTLIPYLLRLASERPIINIDASRFETDANRVVFESEATAVVTFGNAIKISLEDLSRAIMTATAVEGEADAGPAAPAALLATDRRAAARFWGFKVGRALLMKAGEGVNFAFVNRAFGGISVPVPDDDDNEFLSALIGNDSDGRSQEAVDSTDYTTTMVENDFSERSQEDIDPNEEDEIVESVRVVSRRPITGSSTPTQANRAPEVSVTSGSVDTNITGMESSLDDIYDSDSDTEEESDDDDESISDSEERLFMRRSAFDRSKMREGVERHTPCSSHINVYRGHCNVKTVKDVNYFGLQDDYVVSGSDSGHLFIWDKKSSQLLNILEGDGEVVNVVQGHPYEPVLAVSGIDSTIKIFSPDSRLQADAQAGINIANPGNAHSSSLRFHSRRRPASRSHDSPNGTEGEGRGLKSRKCMHESYQITNQNDVERRGGMSDAYITSGMLTQLAARLRERQANGDADGNGDGPTIVLDDNCSIM